MSPHRAGPRADIVFGPIRNPAAAARHRLADLLRSGESLGQGAATVRAGTPALRLNTRGWLRLRPQDVSLLATHHDRVAFCAAHIAISAPLFAGPLRSFVHDYMAFLQARVEHDRPALEGKLAAAGLKAQGGMLDYRDWLYSGFLPLPQAYILLTDTQDGRPSFARIDCAFWTGGTLIAVLLEGHNLRRPSETRALAQLEEQLPFVEFVLVPTSNAADAFAGRLGELLGAFADEAGLPYGLFRVGSAFTGALPDMGDPANPTRRGDT